MSDDPRIQGLLSAIAVPIGDEIAKHHALPPQPKAVARVEMGAGLLGLCGYVGLTGWAALPGSWRIGVVALAAFGFMLLRAGLSSAQAPRNGMTAFWCLAFLGALWWVLAHWLPDVWGNFFGRGLCIYLICAALARLYLAVQGTSGDALDLVNENIRQNEWRW